MNQQSLFRLKKKFRSTFPEHAKLLDLAKTQDEIDELHTRFVSDAKENLITTVKESGASDEITHMLSVSDVAELPPMMLTNDVYESLINAKDHEIENQLHALLDGLQRLSKMKNNTDVGLIVVTCVVVGFLAIGMGALAAYLVYWQSDSSLMGVFFALTDYCLGTLPVLITSIILVVYIILIPILYFMDKPANCVLIVINELDQDIELIERYNTDGHMKGITSKIPCNPHKINGKPYPTVGFFSSVKNQSSLVGTQFGMVMNTGKDTSNFFFSSENPLTSMYAGNNCCCGFNETAERASKLTHKNNKQTFTASNNIIKLSIKCNSTHGSTAYYIARVSNVAIDIGIP